MNIFGTWAFALATAAAQQPSDADFVDRFKTSEPDANLWSVAEYDFDHPKFDTDWRKAQVLTSADGLTLNATSHSEGLNRFVGGSIRRKQTSGYGSYSVRMRAARGQGVVTGFFVYTGPAYGTTHDEIDIEILGHDTSQLNIAWFVDGKITDTRVELGFDAAEDFHDYVFDWREDGIRWSVDGREVFSVDARTARLPSIPGHIFVNLWVADHSIAGWAGQSDPTTRGTAHVDCVAFSPIARNQCSNINLRSPRLE